MGRGAEKVGLGSDGWYGWEWTCWIEVVGMSWGILGGRTGWDNETAPFSELKAVWEQSDQRREGQWTEQALFLIQLPRQSHPQDRVAAQGGK